MRRHNELKTIIFQVFPLTRVRCDGIDMIVSGHMVYAAVCYRPMLRQT